MPHVRLLANLHQQFFIESRTGAVAVLVIRPERDPFPADRVSREAEDVLAAALENAEVVVGTVVRVARRQGD